MQRHLQRALRRLTRVTRPLALRSAGAPGSNTSIVRHIGRRSGRTYDTPVVVAASGDSFLIALPYADRTDWMKNILAQGSATVITDGNTYEVERPEVIPITEATTSFRPKEQRMQRRFRVESALRLHRT
jgi:deazaflavin-dependent oxidoreductase (nitroreductase family)